MAGQSLIGIGVGMMLGCFLVAGLVLLALSDDHKPSMEFEQGFHLKCFEAGGEFDRYKLKDYRHYIVRCRHSGISVDLDRWTGSEQ